MVDTLLPRDITPPSADVVVIEWYRSFFEEVYCILHPFVHVPSRHRHIFDREDGPTRLELSSYCASVPWQTVQRLGQYRSIVGLARALRRAWIDPPVKGEAEESEHHFMNLLEANDLLPPEIGEFSPMIVDDVLRSFLQFGYDQVVVGDQFGQDSSAEQVDGLLESEYPIVGMGDQVVYSPDRSILYAAYWEGAHTFLCASSATVAAAVERFRFEGFLCDKGTHAVWEDSIAE